MKSNERTPSQYFYLSRNTSVTMNGCKEDNPQGSWIQVSTSKSVAGAENTRD